MGYEENNVTAQFHSNIMDGSKEEDPQTLQAVDSTPETFPSSEPLEESWNCRSIVKQEQNLHRLSESLFKERRKLRHVLDWAHRFIGSDSEARREFCRADDLMLAGEGLLEAPNTCRYHHPVSCSVRDNGVFEGGGGGGERSMQKDRHLETSNRHLSASEHPFSDDPGIPSSLIPGRDEIPWREFRDAAESMKSVALQHPTDTRPLCQDNTCTTSGLFSSSEHDKRRESTMFGPVGRDMSEHQVEISKVAKGNVGTQTRESGSALTACAKNNESDSEAADIKEQKEKPSNLGFSLHLKTPPTLTVYEQYRLCVDHLHGLRVRRQQSDARCFTEPPVEAPARPVAHFESRSSTKRETVPGDKVPSPEGVDALTSTTGVAVCDCWLSLPDEVWLSILSLLPHGDLCRVVQVCSRLHTLATDHTLWRDVRIENSNLTEGQLLGVSRRRPRRLCLYGCVGMSLTSGGLEVFLTQCRETLQELKVISCTGFHGDHILRLLSRLCDGVTSVDVSWSDVTDRGVKALHDCCEGLQLESVVLNGCRVTDDPLMKLAMRHKRSLCRLEVFGCQFLTPSCLQTVCETCPGLERLNVGQVPKVTAHSLTVMTSHLKRLTSLNVTGLQAVTDATVDTLLQSCVDLQSLTLMSCPRVTDVALHSISNYAPCIRSLDVSGCKAITDAGVQSLALGCRRLQKVDLSSTGTGSQGVTLLANHCSEHLHTVKLSFCHITSENILKLCRRCTRLKVLHLYGCSHPPTEREIRAVNAGVRVYPPS